MSRRSDLSDRAWRAATAARVEPGLGPQAAESNSLTELSFDEWAKLISTGAGYGLSTAGVDVTPETALRYVTVAACVRVLSESVASLPLILYRKRTDGGKDRATDHPLYTVLHDVANGWNTSFEYGEGQMCNLATRGNGYAYVDRNNKGQTIGLVPLNPDGVSITMARDWSPLYRATMPDGAIVERMPRAQIHHIRGPLPRGFLGRSMIALAREGIGLGLAAEKFGASLFSNGVRSSGYVKHPKTLSDPAIERLRNQIKENNTGLENLLKPLLLEEGMDWVQTSITPDDAQFLETRKFQRADIAGIFRVPAHLINDLERATFANIEHNSLAFVIFSLVPWLVRIQQAISRDLLLPAERAAGYFAEYKVDGLLRGDFKTRMEGHALQIQNGIKSPNEVRIIENDNPRDGGDEYWKPSNMMGDQVAAKAIAAAMNPTTRRALLVELKKQLDEDPPALAA